MIRTPGTDGAPLEVTIIGGGVGSTVDQGAAGLDPWLVDASGSSVSVTNFPGAVSLAHYHVVSAGSTNAAVIKNTPGTLYGVTVFNNAGYPVFVKFYDQATTPNPASDTVTRTLGTQAGLSGGATVNDGQVFSVGIAIAIVKGISDTNATAVVASDCVVDVDYA